jgi:hypothetical protein
MGWEWAMTQEIGRLKRFIVLLFALSVIAQRASNAPAPLRLLLLSILLRAAPVAANYVVSDEPIIFDTGDSRDDLIYMASLFRMAALALSMWVNSAPEHADALAGQHEFRNQIRFKACGGVIQKHVRAKAYHRALSAPDTS